METSNKKHGQTPDLGGNAKKIDSSDDRTMNKKTLILLAFSLCCIFGFYVINKVIKFIDLSSITVSVDNSLNQNAVKIQEGCWDINRKNDSELFISNNLTRTIYNGHRTALLKTEYGENDFLITYDNKYYFQFRHFQFNSRNQHSYNFNLYKQQDTIFVEAKILGPDKMNFRKPMHLISEAIKYRCNTTIDNKNVIYNMTELNNH